MAVADQSFSAQVDEWCRSTTTRMEAVFKDSCQRLVAEAQTAVSAGGHMPVDTGFLRASGRASTNAPQPMDPENVGEKDQKYTFNFGQTETVIASLTIGMRFFFCWTAAYAARIEYGFTGQDSLGRTFNQAGRGFVRLAAQNWPVIVRASIAEARARAGQT